MQQTSTLRRKGRIDDFIEVVDLDDQTQLLPSSACEIEEHHAYVALHFGEGADRRQVRISHRQFKSLFATRQVVYVSW